MPVVLDADVFDLLPGAVAAEGVRPLPGLGQHLGVLEREVQVQEVAILGIQVDALRGRQLIAVRDPRDPQPLAGLGADRR